MRRIVTELDFSSQLDAHGIVRARMLGTIEESNALGHRLEMVQEMPMATVPPPNFVGDVKEIYFRFLDRQVLGFIQSVEPMLGGECMLRFNDGMGAWPVGDRRIQPIRQLLTLFGNKLYGLDLFYHPISFHHFVQHFAQFIGNLQFLSVAPTLGDFALLFQWLTTPRADGRQKILELTIMNVVVSNAIGRFVQHLQEDFSAATQPANFFISIRSYFGQFAESTAENEGTGETLAIYQRGGNPGPDLQIVRHPSGQNQWKEIGEGCLACRNIHSQVRLILDEQMEIGNF